MKRILGILLAGAATALCLVGLAPAAPAGPTNEDCLGCHADKGLVKEVRGKKVSLYADAGVLKASVHGRLACTACHAGIKEVPHAEKVPPVSCSGCHGPASGKFAQSVHGRKDGPQLDCQTCHGAHVVKPAAQLGPAACEACHQPMVQEWQAGVHGKAVAQGVKEAAQCRDCHGTTHELLSQQDPGAPTSRAKMAETCARCHADRTLIEKRQIPVPQAFQLYQKSVHGRAVAAGKPAATCNNCHASHQILRANDPKSTVYRENIPQMCGSCHGEETKVYLGSIHGTAMRHGATKSPVCTDCHGEHSITGAQDPNSRVSVAQVTKTCASCHQALEITEKYGLPGNRVATYQDSFHGLAARGGNLTAANCSSCHGFHDVRPSADPKSSIHANNLQATCGKCHPGASENFAKGSVHVSGTRQDAPILYYVRIFYLLMILGTIGGMVAHNGLDFLKKMRREYRRRGGGRGAVTADTYAAHAAEPPRFYLRMSAFERWQHVLLAASFIVLVYTGFALKFPESWPFAWLVALETGYAWRGLGPPGGGPGDAPGVFAPRGLSADPPGARPRPGHAAAALRREGGHSERRVPARHPARRAALRPLQLYREGRVLGGGVGLRGHGRHRLRLVVRNRRAARPAAVGAGSGDADPLLRSLAGQPGHPGMALLLRDLQPGRLSDELDLADREDLGGDAAPRAPAGVRAVARPRRAGVRPR